MNQSKTDSIQQRDTEIKHMIIACPNCQSGRVQNVNAGRKVIGIIGAAIGAVSGAKAGVEHGLIRVVSGALLGAFSGAITGCVAGATLGNILDEETLDNFECLSCNHTFSKQSLT